MVKSINHFIKEPEFLRGLIALPVPEVYQIEVARVCNLKCIMCPIQRFNFFPRKDNTALISVDLVKKIVDEGSLEASYFVELQMSGEPLLHPQLSEIIDIVKSAGVFVGLSTNGVLMEKQIEALSKLNYITFSLDSFEEYDKIRVGKKGFKLHERIKEFLPIAIKNNISVDIQIVEVTGWERQVEIAEKYFKDDDVNVRTVENCYYLHFFPDLKNPISELCLNPWRSVSIQCTGIVTSCCFSMGDDIIYGDINKQSLKEIWAGEEVKKLRMEHRTGKYRAICKKCYQRSPTQFHWKLFTDSIKKRMT